MAEGLEQAYFEVTTRVPTGPPPPTKPPACEKEDEGVKRKVLPRILDMRASATRMNRQGRTVMIPCSLNEWDVGQLRKHK